MKGDPAVIEALNEHLTTELTVINQYFVHAKMCKNWGYQKLAAKFHEESIEEMKHADAIIDRILYLEGIPNMQRLNSVEVGETVAEQLQVMYECEKVATGNLNGYIATCREKSDNGTRELFEKILVEEEDSVDWLESQLDLIKQVGKEHYLAQQINP